MEKIFNNFYIDCKYSCLFNVLTHFGVDPRFLVANNLYKINSKTSKIEYVYFYDNEVLFDLLNIKSYKINEIDDLRKLKLKKNEIAIIKGRMSVDNSSIYLNEKGNFILLNIDDSKANMISRISINTTEYKKHQRPAYIANDSYNLYKKNFYYTGIDKEPTITIYKKSNSYQEKVYNYLIVNYLLISKYNNVLNNNYLELKKVFDKKDEDTLIKFLYKFKRAKNCEKYRCQEIMNSNELVNIINEEIKIIDILPYYILKGKADQKIDELISLEKKYTSFLIQNVNLDSCFFHIYQKRKMPQNINKVFEDYKVESINIQNNSKNGVLIKDNHKYFFKIQTKNNTCKELLGYYCLKGRFTISSLYNSFLYNDYGVIIYKYDYSLKKNKGLLADSFSIKLVDDNYNIINIIKKNYSDEIISNTYPLQNYFDDRVDSRLRNYLNSKWINYDVKIRAFKGSTKPIIKECIDYFNNCKSREYKCVLSHGDLNETNISSIGTFYDYTVSGYNYLTAEIALFVISILFSSTFIDPKYHKNAYKNHNFITENIPEYRCDYQLKDNILTIKTKLYSTKEKKQMILKYLDNLEYDKEIIYYIIMRLLTVFDINTFSEKDRVYIIYLVHYFYNKLKKSKLYDIIQEVEVI